jgi:hypothetical protein
MWSNSCHSPVLQCTHLAASIYLFQFFHGKAEARGTNWRFDRKANNRGSVVVVDIGDLALPNDLISRLAAMLSHYEDRASLHDVIFEPSQVLTFQLRTPQNGSVRSTEPFIFPRFLYLDQFLAKNFGLANEKRTMHRAMQAEIATLMKQKEFIIGFDVCGHSLPKLLPPLIGSFQNKDTLRDIRASLYYYEHVADSNGDEVRQEDITRTTNKLKDILTMMIDKLNG